MHTKKQSQLRRNRYSAILYGVRIPSAVPRRSKVCFAPASFYACGKNRRHPPAPLLLLSKSRPLRWVVIWAGNASGNSLFIALGQNKGTSLRMSLCFGFRSRWPPRPPVIRRSVRNEFPRRNSHLNSRCRSERRVFFSGPAILPESGLIAACNPPRSRKHRAV